MPRLPEIATACSRCTRTLRPEEVRHLPRGIKIPPSIALAVLHGGEWMWQELSQPFCELCFNRLRYLAILFTVLCVTAAFIIIPWLLKLGFEFRGGF